MSGQGRDTRLEELVLATLEESKARDVRVLEVAELTSITDAMIIASGTSDRHVKAMADKVIEAAKAAGYRPLGVEGERQGEWVLVDLDEVLVHLMLPRVREFYDLEKLWDREIRREPAHGES